jgi:hypothetical protein
MGVKVTRVRDNVRDVVTKLRLTIPAAEAKERYNDYERGGGGNIIEGPSTWGNTFMPSKETGSVGIRHHSDRGAGIPIP